MGEIIVVIEDDEDILEVLTVYIQSAGYTLYTAKTFLEGKNLIDTYSPDVIIVDINLPDGNGFDLARVIRQYSNAILVFLTANGSIEYKLKGFDIGADDYITKPFIPKELIARIQAQLNRHKRQENILQIQSLYINFDTKEVFKNHTLLPLFVKEKQVLFYLIEKADKVVSTEQLLNHIWGYDGVVNNKTLNVHISSLRKKIEDNPSDPKRILTIRGFGYMFSTK